MQGGFSNKYGGAYEDRTRDLMHMIDGYAGPYD